MTHPLLAHIRGEVLLVGNAPHGDKPKGELINGYGTVIRFNKGACKKILQEHCVYIGVKTDIIVTNLVSLDNLDETMKGIPILFNQPMNRGTVSFYPKEQEKARRMTQDIMVIPDDVVTFCKTHFNYSSPSTGLKTAILLSMLSIPFKIVNFSSDPNFTHFYGGSDGVGRHTPSVEAEIVLSLTSGLL